MKEETSNQHFKNLLSLALADEILDKSEIDFIFERSGKYFITQSEIDGVIDNVIHVKSARVENTEERAIQLLDLIELMLLDGETHEQERRVSLILGVSIGFNADSLENLINATVKMLEAGDSRDEILAAIKNHG